METEHNFDFGLAEDVASMDDETWIIIDEGELQKIVREVEDKANALHAHNMIRTLHGLELLDWDEELAEGAREWAMHLAQADCGLSHSSPLITYGENIYISNGSLEPSRSHHAVLLWYRGIEHFDFQSRGFNLASGSFSQVVWKESKTVGVGIAFREDTRTTYIVAQYCPPGNTCYAGSYDDNVSQPTDGMPPRIPRIEDLTAPQPPQRYNHPVEAPYGWAKGIFRSMCKWCTFSGPKLVESWSGCPTLPEKCNSKRKQKELLPSRNIVNCEEDTKGDTDVIPIEKHVDNVVNCEEDTKCDIEVKPIEKHVDNVVNCEEDTKCDIEVKPIDKRIIYLTANSENEGEIASTSSIHLHLNELEDVDDDNVNSVAAVKDSVATITGELAKNEI